MREGRPEHTVNLTPAGSGLTRILLMSYEASGSRPGKVSKGGNTHIVQNVIFNLNYPIFIQGGRDVAWPNYYTHEVRDFGTARVRRALTFVPPIDFLHMV